ncbi:MAG: alpha/beta hydrolase [Gammaproteobacteria bacterium]|nr:alpha/beta hydrolase [Gammaproteobacteria bacterium]
MDCEVSSTLCREFSLDINGLSYAVKQWGKEDGEPVIALHGWLDNANTFDKIAPLFPDLKIYAVDLAGHGYSGHRPGWGQYHFYEYVYDVLEIADQLGLERFSLMGHSMGAHIALITAGMEPEKVNKLFMIEGFGTPSEIAPDAVPDMAQVAYRKAVSLRTGKAPQYASFDAMVKARTSGFFQLSDEAARTLCQRMIHREGDHYRWRFDPKLKYMSPTILSHEQFCAFAKKVTAPSHLIIADKGVPIMAHLLEERIAVHPNLVVKDLVGGHHLHLEEQYQEVAQLLGDFMQTTVNL